MALHTNNNTKIINIPPTLTESTFQDIVQENVLCELNEFPLSERIDAHISQNKSSYRCQTGCSSKITD